MARNLAAFLAAVALLTGCSPDVGPVPASHPASVVVRDDAGRTVRLRTHARRVISLVPSVTEAIVAMGASERLVGRTRYDTAPEVQDLPSVGGGLDPSLEAVVALRPDLVIGWDASGYRGLRPGLEASGIPLFAVRVEDTTDVFRAFGQLGTLLGLPVSAGRAGEALRDSLAAVAAGSFPAGRPTVFFALLGDPPRTAGPRTFIAQLIRIAGGEPAFTDLAGDWPEVSLEAVLDRRPDVIVVPESGTAGGVEALADQPGWRDLEAVRQGRVVAVPADLFNRPGPHLAVAARALERALAEKWPPDAAVREGRRR